MMIEISDIQYAHIITALIGAAVCIIALSMRAKRKNLLRSGIRAEGIVYHIKRENTFGGDSSQTYSYPVVRFITVEKEWVTEKYEYAVSSDSSTINPSYKEGDKVTVIYDPTDIKNFIIDDLNSKMVSTIFLTIGLLAFVGAIVHYVYFIDLNY